MKLPVLLAKNKINQPVGRIQRGLSNATCENILFTLASAGKFITALAVTKVGDHDHEVDEVEWTDRAEALRRLRYDSDRHLLGLEL